jgi:hypothetical protein
MVGNHLHLPRARGNDKEVLQPLSSTEDLRIRIHQNEILCNGGFREEVPKKTGNEKISEFTLPHPQPSHEKADLFPTQHLSLHLIVENNNSTMVGYDNCPDYAPAL